MNLASPTALATQVSEVGGRHLVTSLLGVAQLISEAAANVRVNGDAAFALSRRVAELVGVVVSGIEANDGHPVVQGLVESLENFESVLFECRDFMQQQETTGYLRQIVYRERDADKIKAMSERVRHAFESVSLRMRLHLHDAIGELTRTLERSAAFDELEDFRSAAARAAITSNIPPSPPLFFGRDKQVQAIADLILKPPNAYVAILGGPGMGKTSLVCTTLHDPEIVARFGTHRYFVPCDGAEARLGCLTAVAGSLGIADANQRSASKKIAATLGTGPTLLVLDNFESAWEPHSHRADAEAALAFLATIDGLSLILTMRGSERPHGILWTRPYLPPLNPLDDEAALQTFLSIAEFSDNKPRLHDLLHHLDNIPLALVLMANLAQYESSTALLARWDEFKTGMLRRGDGQHRLNSLDTSIAVSLGSPRMQDAPGGLRLLSLLSLLPHGAMDPDVLSWSTAVEKSSQALSALLQTALAFRAPTGRVHVLAPIREFMLVHHFPSPEVAGPVYAHYLALAELTLDIEGGVTVSHSVSAITPEVENIESIIRHALARDVDAVRAVKASMRMCALYNATGIGAPFSLLQEALSVARRSALDDLTAELLFHWAFMSYATEVPGDPAALYLEARDIWQSTGNVDGMIKATLKLIWFMPDPQEAVQAAKAMCALAESREDAENVSRTPWCYQRLAVAYERAGDFSAARSCHERAIALLELSGKPAHRHAGYSMTKIAEYAVYMGETANAIALLHKAIPILQASNYVQGVVRAQRLLGGAELERGNAVAAVSHLREALSTLRSGGYVKFEIECLVWLARAHVSAYDEVAAADDLSRAEMLLPGDSGDLTHARGTILCVRGQLAICRGFPDDARAVLNVARALALGDSATEARESMRTLEAHVLEHLGEADRAEGKQADASASFLLATISYDRLGLRTFTVRALSLLASTVDDEAAEVLILATMPPLLRFGFLRDQACLLLHYATIAQRRGQVGVARHRAQQALLHFKDVKDERGAYRAQMFLQDLAVGPINYAP